jgi:superoxide reductase
MKMKFYYCKHCGNIVVYADDKGVPVICCGDKMVELIPNTVDAATEKHVPVINVDGNKVTVTIGSVDHPMVPNHYIQWVVLATKQGMQRKALEPGMAPQVCFMLCPDDEVVEAYEYCNLHGLWKSI